ncbi:MAG: hypothetical protein QM767_05020 [Anaeromyxobacter sp.]
MPYRSTTNWQQRRSASRTRYLPRYLRDFAPEMEIFELGGRFLERAPLEVDERHGSRVRLGQRRDQLAYARGHAGVLADTSSSPPSSRAEEEEAGTASPVPALESTTALRATANSHPERLGHRSRAARRPDERG